MIDTELVIVGAGPAGLFATFYAGMRGLDVTLVDNLPHLGGQVSSLYPEKFVYDIAALPAVTGRDLISGLVQQALSANPRVLLEEECVALEEQVDGSLVVTTAASNSIRCRAVLITGGIGRFTPRPLPAVDAYRGDGVHRLVGPAQDYAAHDVIVVGGGDSAVDWANMLQPVAASVTVIHRRDRFTAHERSIEQLRSSGARILTGTELVEVTGEERVNSITVRRGDGALETLTASVIIPALGHIASLGALSSWGLAVSGRTISVATDMSTGRRAVYAAGDITDYPGKVALMAVGFGEAATAVNNIAVLLRPGEGIFPGHSSELPNPQRTQIGV